MCFSVSLQLPPTLLPPAGLIEKQIYQSEGQDAFPPPSTFQRKCKSQGTRVSPSKTVAVLRCGLRLRYGKDPIWKSEVYPVRIESDEIERSVQMIEDMLDVANEVLETAVDFSTPDQE